MTTSKMFLSMRSRSPQRGVRRAVCWACVAAALALAAMAPAAVQAQENSNQIALVTLSSYDEIVADVGFIGRLGGQPHMAQQMEGMLQFVTGGRGLVGLEKSKPIGIAVSADGADVTVKGLIPVSDMDELLDLLGTWGIIAEDGEDGVKELAAQGQTLYAKEADGYAVIGYTPAAAKSGAAGAEAMINTLAGDYDIAARVFVQNIPSEYRNMAIEQLKAGMEMGMRRNPGESDQQFEMRKNLTQAQVEQFSQLLEDADQLTFGWSIDGQQAKTFVDFMLTAAPGTKLARQIAEAENLTTDYAGFYQPDAAATMTFCGKVTQEDIDQATQMFEGVRKQVMQQIQEEAGLPDDQAREVVKSAVGDFFDAFVATLKGGKIDGGAVLNMDPSGLTFVMGGLVAEPDKIESGLKKLEALAEQDDDFPGVSWNADQHGEISFHTIHVPVPDHEDEARQMFGDQLEIGIGTGGKSAYFAIGRDAVAGCKQIIDASKANAGKEVPPMEMTASLGKIMATVSQIEPNPIVTKISDMLESEAQGRDHIRIVEHVIDNGIKVRIELEEGVLRAIGTAIAEGRGGGF